MKINGKSYDTIRPAVQKPAGSVQGPTTASPNAQPTTATTGTTGATSGRSDSVQISDAGRALATGATGGSGAASSLTAERIAELRKRVLEGAYNSTHVVDQVAKRILERGDA